MKPWQPRMDGRCRPERNSSCCIRTMRGLVENVKPLIVSGFSYVQILIDNMDIMSKVSNTINTGGRKGGEIIIYFRISYRRSS